MKLTRSSKQQRAERAGAAGRGLGAPESVVKRSCQVKSFVLATNEARRGEATKAACARRKKAGPALYTPGHKCNALDTVEVDGWEHDLSSRREEREKGRGRGNGPAGQARHTHRLLLRRGTHTPAAAAAAAASRQPRARCSLILRGGRHTDLLVIRPLSPAATLASRPSPYPSPSPRASSSFPDTAPGMSSSLFDAHATSSSSTLLDSVSSVVSTFFPTAHADEGDDEGEGEGEGGEDGGDGAEEEAEEEEEEEEDDEPEDNMPQIYERECGWTDVERRRRRRGRRCRCRRRGWPGQRVVIADGGIEWRALLALMTDTPLRLACLRRMRELPGVRPGQAPLSRVPGARRSGRGLQGRELRRGVVRAAAKRTAQRRGKCGERGKAHVLTEPPITSTPLLLHDCRQSNSSCAFGAGSALSHPFSDGMADAVTPPLPPPPHQSTWPTVPPHAVRRASSRASSKAMSHSVPLTLFPYQESGGGISHVSLVCTCGAL